MSTKSLTQNKLIWCFYAILVGVLSGLATTLFLISLNPVTHFRTENPNLVYGLPLAGLLIGLIYQYYGKDVQPGTGLILDEIHDPKKVIPLRLSPAILTTTLLTHLFGGSAGREGTAVQMGSSLADQLSRYFPIRNDERKILLVAGAGSGFGAALGAPFAGIFFGMEIIRQGRLKPFAIIECTLASFTAYSVTRLCGAPHTRFPQFTISYSWNAILWTALASLLFAILVRTFFFSTHFIEKSLQKFVPYSPLKPFIGGLILVFLFKGLHLELFEGLGIETLLGAFQAPLPASFFILKLLLTALTLGSGFKGGEFVPLIFIGAVAGAFLSGMTHLDMPLLQALGCAALFGAASKTPFSCSIMAIELFGWQIAPFAFLACYLSTGLSGRNTIYKRYTPDAR